MKRVWKKINTKKQGKVSGKDSSLEDTTKMDSKDRKLEESLVRTITLKTQQRESGKDS